MERRSLLVQGVSRSYRLAAEIRTGAPALIVLHGTGLNGEQMARWTNLGQRGVEAGFNVAFPDAEGGMWDDMGHRRVDGLDDPAFIAALVRELGLEKGAVFLVGLSNGAFFAEHLARYGVVAVAGIALVAGTARVTSREEHPIPAQRAGVVIIAGTADRVVPYGGGAAAGLMGRLARRRGRKMFGTAAGREAVAFESLAADWAFGNGCSMEPVVQPTNTAAVDRLQWVCEGCPPVTLYRIGGGGHGWPGGPQYAPRFLIGRVSPGFDATGAVLDFARAMS